MKRALFSALAYKPWTVNLVTVVLILLAWWIVWGFAKCEYPTGSYDQIPFHGRVILTLLCSCVTGLCAVEMLEYLRTLKP